jgi:hypothetical protein
MIYEIVMDTRDVITGIVSGPCFTRYEDAVEYCEYMGFETDRILEIH